MTGWRGGWAACVCRIGALGTGRQRAPSAGEDPIRIVAALICQRGALGLGFPLWEPQARFHMGLQPHLQKQRMRNAHTMTLVNEMP